MNQDEKQDDLCARTPVGGKVKRRKDSSVADN